MRKNTLAVAVAALLGFAGTSAFATQVTLPTYTAVDLNSSSVGTFGSALGADGSVFGMFQTAAGTLNAFATGANGSNFQDLSSFSADYAQAVGAGVAGQIVVNAPFSGNSSTLVLASDGSLSAALSGFAAVGVNANGQIAGNTANGAAVVDASGQQTNIGGPTSVASAINASGQVTGYFTGSDGKSHAFISNPNGSIRDLGAGAGGAYAFGLNNRGQATGSLYSADGSSADLFVSATGGLRDLGTLASGTYMFGQAINDVGAIVGIDFNASSGVNTPFIYEAGELVDLASLLDPTLAASLTYTAVSAINNLGQILLSGTLSDGSAHSYLLTPKSAPPNGDASVPEPLTAGLLALGVVGMALARRRQMDFTKI